MQIQPGPKQAFHIASATGRCVATFDDRDVAEAWIRRRTGNGVTYRLFEEKTTFVELGVRRAELLRLAQG